jgi:hypothetical protein
MDRIHPTRARCFTGSKPHRINILAATQTKSIFCRSHARQNRIFSHNQNLFSVLSSGSIQSIYCPALSSQLYDSKPLTHKLFIIYILPVTATGQTTYAPLHRQGGMAGGGGERKTN